MKALILLLLVAFASSCQNDPVPDKATSSTIALGLDVSISSELISSEVMSITLKNHNLLKTTSGQQGETSWSTDRIKLNPGDTVRWFVTHYDMSSLNCNQVNIDVVVDDQKFESHLLELGAPPANCANGHYFTAKFTVP